MRRLKVKLFTGLCPKLRRLDVRAAAHETPGERGPDLNFRLACIKDAHYGAAAPECVGAARQVNSSKFNEDEREKKGGNGKEAAVWAGVYQIARAGEVGSPLVRF